MTQPPNPLAAYYDRFQRFQFDGLGIRGEIVQLRNAFKTIQGHAPYPSWAIPSLGEALSAAVLLSGTIKFEGALILQVQGNGAIPVLVAQCTHQRTIRGLLRYNDPPESLHFASLFGEARMVLTIQRNDYEPYQGIVGLEGNSLAEAIESYFQQSEQLPTRLWLFSDQDRAGGLFLQTLPGVNDRSESWNRINQLAQTVTQKELLELSMEEMLYRLFNEERVLLQEPEPVYFRCSCSRRRISEVLEGLGREELESILVEQGEVSVTCEFCNRNYAFDSVDIESLLSGRPASPTHTRKQ